MPRFPRKYSTSEIKENYALKDFEIVILPPDRTLSLTAVRNEQISAQIALGAKKELSNVSIQISDFKTLDDEVLSKENIQIRYVKYIQLIHTNPQELSDSSKTHFLFYKFIAITTIRK